MRLPTGTVPIIYWQAYLPSHQSLRAATTPLVNQTARPHLLLRRPQIGCANH